METNDLKSSQADVLADLRTYYASEIRQKTS